MVEGSTCPSAIINAVADATNSNKINCFMLMQRKSNTIEGDVYVNKFYEQAVPEYSESTYIKHFKLSRTAIWPVLEFVISAWSFLKSSCIFSFLISGSSEY